MTKNAVTEIAKEGGKAAVVQTTKSAVTEVAKEGGKVGVIGIATAAVQEVSKELLEESGKAATNQASKSAAKVAVQQVSIKRHLNKGPKIPQLK